MAQESLLLVIQDESLFENLEGGIYTIIVNDKNGCAPDATLTTIGNTIP